MDFISLWFFLRRVSVFIALFPVFFFLQGCGGARTGGFSPEGRWVIDVEATAEYARQSPRWTPEDEEMLPFMLDMLSENYFLEIKPDSIVIEQRGRAAEIPVAIEESSAGERVYKGFFDGREVFFTVSARGKDGINLRVSESPDFDYLLWKRNGR